VLTGLATIAQRHAGESVLAFTHGGVLDVVYRAATGRAIDAPRDFTLGNAALNWLDYNGGRWQLIAWADSRHLRAALDELPG
jgi:probable phosphoglycerate mutase